MKLRSTGGLAALFALSLASLAATACHDRHPAEGPGAYTGRKVDEGAAKTKDAVETGAHETKQGAKAAAHDTKCAAKNAKDDAEDQPRDPACD